jgi:hypothetical protein
MEVVSDKHSANTNEVAFGLLLKSLRKHRQMIILGVVQILQQSRGINSSTNYIPVISLDFSGISMPKVFSCILDLVNMAVLEPSL